MMKKIVAVCIAILLLAAAISGCKGSDKGDVESVSDKIVQKAEDTAKTDAPASEQTPEQTAAPTATPAQTPTPEPSANGILYQNEKFGFSIEFPRSWEGKFSISEFDNGISVTFRPEATIEEGKGHLFSLVKNPTEDEASFLDGAKWIQTDDASYVYGGPTDVTYFEEDPEYDTFVEMRDQIPEIMQSLK